MADERPINRRSFFRAGLRELLNPLASAISPLESVARQLGEMQAPQTRRVPLKVILRPPGALPNDQFEQQCSRCGECVNVCPAQCISMDPLKNVGTGAPYIDPDIMPCVVCEGLKCTHSCPTGALVPTLLADINMGTAQWKPGTCLRSQGEDCTICIDKCPLGSTAIELRGHRIHVHEAGCIGCGICQHECPTRPRSIVVVPPDA